MSLVLGLGAFVAANLAAASSGALFRPGDWYRELKKPDWRPPDWLFGPVWLVLYICIAISGWLVWRESGFSGAAVALSIYAIQLVLNWLWSLLFFGLRRPDWALVDVVLLLLSIGTTIWAFFSVQPVAAYLLMPYACWVAFASILNLDIWWRNRPALD